MSGERQTLPEDTQFNLFRISQIVQRNGCITGAARSALGRPFLPPLPQQAEDLGWQHHVSILAVFRLHGANDHLLTSISLPASIDPLQTAGRIVPIPRKALLTRRELISGGGFRYRSLNKVHQPKRRQRCRHDNVA